MEDPKLAVSDNFLIVALFCPVLNYDWKSEWDIFLNFLVQSWVGCFICVCCACAQSLIPVWLFVTPWTVAMLLFPWDFPGKNTGMGCHFLLQGILLIQGSNLHLLHWQVDSLLPEPPGNTHLLYKRYSARKFLCWLFFNPPKSPLMLVLQPLYFTDGAQWGLNNLTSSNM